MSWGLSHHTSPVELRERLAFSDTALPAALLQLHKRLDGAGVVILSTCNRVEIYAHHADPAEKVEGCLRAFLTEWHGVPESEIAEALYAYAGAEAVGHLFRVASSLDSLVVGETQILGQVHDAFLQAQAEQTTDKIISALFQKSFSVAKTVRSESSIAAGKVSISSVAVDLAVSIFGDLSNKTVMVIGSGEMGELTLRSLVAQGVRRVLVANRSLEKAQALAAQYSGDAIGLDALSASLASADIVISSTAAPGFVLRPDDFNHALKQRDQEPMFVIDIAVPRDIDPAVNELDNVYLYDVDDLQEVADKNLDERRREVARCMEIVDRAVDQFQHWMQGLVAEPTIVSMSEELNAIREQELAKTFAKLKDLTEEQRNEIAYLSQRIVNTILQRPMQHIKHEVGHHDPQTVLHLAKRFFGLKDKT